MAFDRLQKLGEEKFRAITNALLREQPAMQVARMIRTDWGDFQDVAEKTLTMQLLRLKADMRSGRFSTKAAEEAKALVKNGEHVDVKMLRKSKLDVLGELQDICHLQKKRIMKLVEKEENLPLPISGLSTIIMDYKEMLVTVQKIQFDLGVDAFKGVIPGARVAVETVQKPDGTVASRTIVDAVGVLEDVMSKRRVPVPELTSGAQV